MNSKSIELLAPAGDFEAVVAAVQNGANAIYLGYTQLSARQNANNFDDNELREAVSYCHSRGVLVYLALNTIVFDTQMDMATATIKMACTLGIDALIVQDLGIVKLAKEICPEMPLHASTQMAVHTQKGAELLANYGFKRVVIARECSLEEIKDITKNVDIEVEVFVHGSLCMSVSGQCYISGMIGARSGNRGNCAGTCRLPFSSNHDGGYDLSLKDNCLISHVEKLKQAGVTSMKIEGRMKRPEYVAVAAQEYNNAKQNKEYDTEKLKAIFSRSGFTDGYFINKADKEMFGFRQKDDVISATNKILKSISNSYKKERPLVQINMTFKAFQDKPIELIVSDLDGNSMSVTGAVPEKPINSPMNEESALRALSKLGSTMFYLGEFKAEIDDDIIVPASAINEIRRSACEKLADIRGEIKPKQFIDINPQIMQNDRENQKLSLRASFTTVSQVPFEAVEMLEYVILPIDEVIANFARLENFKEKIIVSPYRIMFSKEKGQFEKLSKLKKLGFTKVMAENLAHIQMANELELTIFGGSYLNCVNSLCANELCDLGVSDITLSFEIELRNAQRIRSNCKIGLLAYGYLPLMIMKNCPIKQKMNCADCRGEKSLTDRMGKKFRVVCNSMKYSEILNTNALFMADRLHEFTNIDFATLYFTVESNEKVEDIISLFQNRTAPLGEFTRGLYYRSI